MATETLHLLSNALEILPGDSLINDGQLVSVLRWCNERIVATSSPAFVHAISRLLLVLSSRAFEQTLHDALLMEYLKLLTHCLKAGKADVRDEQTPSSLTSEDVVDPWARLHCLRGLELRAQTSTDAHVIAAYLMNDAQIREMATPFLERVKKDESERETLLKLKKGVEVLKRARRKNCTAVKLESNATDKASTETEAKPDVVEPSSSGCDAEEKATESMDFNMMSDDDDEIFSQVLSQESEISRGGETVIPVGSSRESSQQSDSWMDESKTTTKSKTVTSTATGLGDGEDDTQIVEKTTSKVMVNDNDDNVIVIPSSPSTQNLSAESQGNAEDATAFQHLVDEALKGVHEDVKMLASYCANLKALLPEGKLGQSTIDGINDCLDDLKSCL